MRNGRLTVVTLSSTIGKPDVQAKAVPFEAAGDSLLVYEDDARPDDGGIWISGAINPWPPEKYDRVMAEVITAARQAWGSR